MGFYFFRLCWKNIWRNRRRTLITVNAIGVGVMALVYIYNYYDSFHEQLIQNVIRYQSGHLLLTAPNYLENLAPGKYLKNVAPIQKWLSKEKSVKAYSPRVLVQGLLSSPKGSANILFTGIDPEREKTVTRYSKNIVRGSYLDATKPRSVLIGVKLAKILKLDIGDKTVALSQGVDGSIGNELFHVAGIFDTQSDADKSLAFILISDARSLLSISEKTSAHQVAVVLKKDLDLAPMQALMRETFSAKAVEISSWKQVNKPLMGMIELTKSVNRLLMIIILLIAALGIANSILMSILERTREFGVMMAIGTTKREVVKMVILETFLLSSVGVFVGNVMGIALTMYFNRIGFDLKWLTSQQIVVQGAIVQTVSYPTVAWNNLFLITSVILILSMVVSFIPVRHVAGLNTVKALRQ